MGALVVKILDLYILRYSFQNSSPVFLSIQISLSFSHCKALQGDICAIFIQDFQGAQELLCCVAVLCSGQLKSALWLLLRCAEAKGGLNFGSL